MFDKRKTLIEAIEKERPGRTTVCFFNFDRSAEPAIIPGIGTLFHAEAKESLFRVLKETKAGSKKTKIDLCLYTRGGDTNSVWPIVNLLREFDSDFEVLVPFRCHSSGTLLALGARRIVLGPLSELSPIDPSTGNQFNPPDPNQPPNRLAISVEDVRAYRDFLVDQLKVSSKAIDVTVLAPFLERLAARVHPLALGNVHRVLQQIQRLAKELLSLHHKERKVEQIVRALTTEFYSHVHMISRHEARQILGEEQVVFASEKLASALDELLRCYEDQFQLRRPLVLRAKMGDEQEKEVRIVGGVVESAAWSYLFETTGRIRQFSKIPPGMQVQLPAGQGLPLIAGLPREFAVEVFSQGWVHNKGSEEVTV